MTCMMTVSFSDRIGRNPHPRECLQPKHFYFYCCCKIIQMHICTHTHTHSHALSLSLSLTHTQTHTLTHTHARPHARMHAHTHTHTHTHTHAHYPHELCVCVQICGILYLSTAVSEKLLSFYTKPPLDACTYFGLDSGQPPLKVMFSL